MFCLNTCHNYIVMFSYVFVCVPFVCKNVFLTIRPFILRLLQSAIGIFSWVSLQPRFFVAVIFVRGNIAPKVLATIKNSTGPPPAAFPLKSQYVPVICEAAHKAGAACEDEEEHVRVAGGEADKESGMKRKAPGASKSDWNYNHHRMTFINQMKKQRGMSCADAQEAWNSSKEKYSLLGGLSVGELKKRRFLPKGSTENPWAPKSE